MVERTPEEACPSGRLARMSRSGDVGEGLPARARIISPSLLEPAEIVIFELKPSLWYVVFISLPVVAAGAALVVLSLATGGLLDQPWRYLIAVVGVCVMGLRVALALVEWLGRTYVLTDRRVLKQLGVIDVRVECMGLEEIASTFVAQASFQRLLAIGTIFCRAGHDRSRCETHTWEHVPRPKEVHGHIVLQIERWKQARRAVGPAGGAAET
jgi:hypothetical protein